MYIISLETFILFLFLTNTDFPIRFKSYMQSNQITF